MDSLSVVKRNIVANVLGGVWVLVLGLLLVPTQFKTLGSEVVGLLGFVATLQMIFSIFDFGLGPTVLREVASDSSADYEQSRELIRAATIVYWVVAAILGISLTLAASWLTENWITLDKLTKEYAILTIQMLALRLFIAWPLGLYVSVLSGIQRLDIVNSLRVFTNTLSISGGIIILLISRDLHIFLWWIISNSVLSLILHMIACYRYFPRVSLIPKFSQKVFKRVWRFSLDMNILSIQGILLTQVDNMMVSYLLPLRMLGYYAGAYNINEKSLYTFSGFLSNAMLPSLSQDFGQGRIDWLKMRFQKYLQIVTYFSMIPTFIFILWGYDVLRIWTTPEVAEGAYTALAILSIGFLLHAMMIPYLILCIATNNTQIARNANWAGIGVYLAGCYFLILRWEINGAALAWLLLNVYYLFTILPSTRSKILNSRPFAWIYEDFLRFALPACVWFGIGRVILEIPTSNNEIIVWGICGIAVACYSVSGFFCLEKTLQKDIWKLIAKILNPALVFLKFRNRF